jgi:hypothetical protein
MLVAAGFFLLTLRAVGFLGSSTPAPTGLADRSNAATSAQPSAAVPPAAAPAAGSSTPRAEGTINLLNVKEGAHIVAANEAGWKDYIFERPAQFDRLGVFVDATSSYHVKTVELHVSDDSERGPFRKIASFTVPNYRNERQPFHEFPFAPVSARYVKLVAIDWQDRPGGPNGNVCTMQLLGTLQ